MTVARFRGEAGDMLEPQQGIWSPGKTAAGGKDLLTCTLVWAPYGLCDGDKGKPLGPAVLLGTLGTLRLRRGWLRPQVERRRWGGHNDLMAPAPGKGGDTVVELLVLGDGDAIAGRLGKALTN